MQGFYLTEKQWSKIARRITTELDKRGLASNQSIRSKRAKKIVEAVRKKILRTFPELWFYVPHQYLEKGTYHIIRGIQARRKRGSSRADRRVELPAIPPKPAPPAIIAPDPMMPPLETRADLSSPAVSSELAAQPTPDPTSPAVMPVDASMTSNTSNEANLGPLPSTTTFTQTDITGANPVPSSIHRQNNLKVAQIPPSVHGQLPPAASFPNIQIHEDLRKIQLHAARLNDQKDSSFINLGELLYQNATREGFGAISYSCLEDLNYQDWRYWCSTILTNDLDTGFDFCIDRIYHDNGGGEMIRVKNVRNWRAAMIAMRTAGLTHFKFYIEQPVQRESTLN